MSNPFEDKSRRVQKDLDPLDLLCRAITEAAVTARLTEMIEEAGSE